MSDPKNKDKDVEVFLRSIADRFAGVDEGVVRMFRMLVAVTLNYRDELEAKGQVLTVQTTKDALDAFMHVMKAHTVPENLSPEAHQLVLYWLEEIKKTVHN